MKVRRSLFTVLVMMLAATVACSCSSRLRLKFSLSKGESYKMKVVTEQKTSLTVETMKLEDVLTVSSVYAFQITDVDGDGNMTVKATYDSVTCSYKGAQGTSEYDSANPPDVIDDVAKPFAYAVGESFSVKMSPDGTITEVFGLDDMMKRMLKKFDTPEGPMRTPVENRIKKRYSDRVVKHRVQEIFGKHPEKLLDIGDSYQRTESAIPETSFTAESTWTLKSREGGVALFTVVSKLKPNPDAEPIQIGDAKARQEVSGESKGTVEIDESTGWTRTARATQKLSGTLKVNLPGQDEMSLPISRDITVTIEQVKK